jgi:hypothetical protein
MAGQQLEASKVSKTLVCQGVPSLYLGLRPTGKLAKVTLTACMRKLLTILNAKVDRRSQRRPPRLHNSTSSQAVPDYLRRQISSALLSCKPLLLTPDVPVPEQTGSSDVAKCASSQDSSLRHNKLALQRRE